MQTMGKSVIQTTDVTNIHCRMKQVAEKMAGRRATKEKTDDSLPNDTAAVKSSSRKAWESHVDSVSEKATGAWKTMQKRTNAARVSVDETVKALRSSYTNAGEGVREINLKLIDVISKDMNHYLDVIRKLARAKSIKEIAELHSEYLRTQVETSVKNVKALSELANSKASAAVQPIRESAKRTREAS